MHLLVRGLLPAKNGVIFSYVLVLYTTVTTPSNAKGIMERREILNRHLHFYQKKGTLFFFFFFRLQLCDERRLNEGVALCFALWAHKEADDDATTSI